MPSQSNNWDLLYEKFELAMTLITLKCDFFFRELSVNHGLAIRDLSIEDSEGTLISDAPSCCLFSDSHHSLKHARAKIKSNNVTTVYKSVGFHQASAMQASGTALLWVL